MQINADFSRRAAMHAAAMAWVPSPLPGVDRRMLDRIGGEVARATSIVRYAAGSAFSAHTHDGGEEFLVLDGVFQDEHGDYPAGTYVRNPPASRHTPGSAQGCTIFVKLWQFDPSERSLLCVQPAAQVWARDVDRPGVQTAPLFADAYEFVRLERWAPQTELTLQTSRGLELLVLEGSFGEDGESFELHSWLRLPERVGVRATAGPAGCLVWVKSGYFGERSRRGLLDRHAAYSERPLHT